jgi:indolepyruvate ferredoxin oxidoreductase
MQAFADLGLEGRHSPSMGISVYKVAMSWPLETDGARAFARGHEGMLVVEEKRANVETQLKDALYGQAGAAASRRASRAARDLGIHAPAGGARAGGALRRRPAPAARAAGPYRRAAPGAIGAAVIPIRAPYFCSGCPHNTSTRTPDGSRTGGGIGCHVMALAQPELKTDDLLADGRRRRAMGRRGAVLGHGAHMFQNLGDGTYQHSGLLAIRAASPPRPTSPTRSSTTMPSR